jgi:hypothetical protein
MGGVCSGEDEGSRGDTLIGEAVVDVVRSQEADAAVTVLVVVPIEEWAAVGAAVLRGAEPRGKVGPVLERLELRLRENGVSLETFGLEWLCVTPRSAYRCAIVFEVIDARGQRGWQAGRR